jgi:hypothetical protein
MLKSIIRFVYVGFEILTAVFMNSSISWDTTPRSPLKVNRRFGGTCRLHLQRRRISQARNQRESGGKQSLISRLAFNGIHGVISQKGHVGFVVDKVALEKVFSEYFGFPCRSSFHRLFHNHHHLPTGAGTIGQQWPTYQVDSVSPHPEKLTNYIPEDRTPSDMILSANHIFFI